MGLIVSDCVLSWVISGIGLISPLTPSEWIPGITVLLFSRHPFGPTWLELFHLFDILARNNYSHPTSHHSFPQFLRTFHSVKSVSLVFIASHFPSRFFPFSELNLKPVQAPLNHHILDIPLHPFIFSNTFCSAKRADIQKIWRTLLEQSKLVRHSLVSASTFR